MDRCGVCCFWRCKDGCKCKCHVPKQEALQVACTDPHCPCGGACYHGHMDRQKVVVTVDEMEVRKQLWLGHGHSFISLYGDDGEMQCALCQLHDYKRDDIFALLSQAVANLREQHATEVTQAINQGREQGISEMRAVHARELEGNRDVTP